MFSSKNLQVDTASSFTNKTIEPGTHVVKINQITYEPTPYDSEAYNLTYHVETEPIEGFEGFMRDVNDPSMGHYEGQVGRVAASRYAFKDKTFDNGNEVKKENQVLNSLVQVALAMDKRDQLDEISANTIEEYVEKAQNVLKDTFVAMTVGGKEWIDQKGYSKYNLFIVKPGKGENAVGKDIEDVVPFDKTNKNHLIPKTPVAKTDDFSIPTVDEDMPF